MKWKIAVLVIAVVATASPWGNWSASGQQARSQGESSRGGQPASNVSSVTKDQFEKWMTELSNWGRWGRDDERGALNLITADKRRQAGALVKTGTTVSLSREIPRALSPKVAGPRPIVQNGSFAHVFV